MFSVELSLLPLTVKGSDSLLICICNQAVAKLFNEHFYLKGFIQHDCMLLCADSITDGLTKWKQTKLRPYQFLIRPTKNKVIKMWRKPEETWTFNTIFPPSATIVRLQHPSVQKVCRRSSLTNAGRGISTRPPSPKTTRQLRHEDRRVWVCEREQTHFVQLICFMFMWWLKTEKACMHVHVPPIHPSKQTETEGMALFIASSRRATGSHQPEAKKRPSRLSPKSLPPCSTFEWKHCKSSKQKSKVSFIADLTNSMKLMVCVSGVA